MSGWIERDSAKRLRELAAGVRNSGNAVPMTAAELSYLADRFDALSASRSPRDLEAAAKWLFARMMRERKVTAEWDELEPAFKANWRREAEQFLEALVSGPVLPEGETEDG